MRTCLTSDFVFGHHHHQPASQSASQLRRQLLQVVVVAWRLAADCWNRRGAEAVRGCLWPAPGTPTWWGGGGRRGAAGWSAIPSQMKGILGITFGWVKGMQDATCDGFGTDMDRRIICLIICRE